jgi:nucleoside-diphosphate-sugar epimerase
MRIYVTGSTGFVGRRVVDRALERGHEVVALSRDPSRVAPRARLEARRVDLLELESVLPAIQDCEAGIHAAGVGPGADEKLMHAANVQASRHLAGSARRLAKLSRLVAFTSAAVLEPGDTPYRRAKIGQEAALRTYGLDLTVLRPTLVLGPYAEAADLTALVAKLRAAGPFSLVGRGSNRIQPVAVEDVANAAVAALENPATIGKLYTLAGPNGGITYREFVTGVARRVGATPNLRAVPRFPLAILATVLGLIGRSERLRAALAFYGHDHLYSIDDAARDLGFAPAGYDAMLTAAFGPVPA